MEIAALLKWLEDVFKHPIMTPLYIALIMLTCAIILWKFTKSIAKDVKTEMGVQFSAVKLQMTSYEDAVKDILRNKGLLEDLVKNYPVFKVFADNFGADHKNAFSDVQIQLSYMREAYIKNYLNGSSPDQALGVLQYAQAKVYESLNRLPNKPQTVAIIGEYMSLLDERTARLIKVLASPGLSEDKGHKRMLVSKHFNNFYMLLLFTKYKVGTSSCDNTTDLRKEMENYLDNYDQTHSIADPDVYLAKLAGF